MIFAETERLILRRPRSDDIESYLRSWDDPEMTRHTGKRDNIETFIADLIAEMQAKRPGDTGASGPWYQYTIERRDGGAVAGDIGIGFGVPGERQVEIGYRIHHDHQRQGYAKEAVGGIIAHLIAAQDIHRFVGVAAAANRASIAVLTALGFRQEGHFRQSFLCDGEWVDDYYYALLAEEWSAGRRA